MPKRKVHFHLADSSFPYQKIEGVKIRSILGLNPPEELTGFSQCDSRCQESGPGFQHAMIFQVLPPV